MSLDLVTQKALRALLDEAREQGSKARAFLENAEQWGEQGRTERMVGALWTAVQASEARSEAIEGALRKVVEAITPTRVI
ncbi:MAG TPA: hypothetical protein VKU41_04825 [Polyangiaceae bacterium]|nr:hypothetical protein [Polyangiaceae bacterium]